MTNIRQNNFEVLRVVSIFLIIVSHCIYFGIKQHPIHQSFNPYDVASLIDYILTEGIYLLAGIGVNCFVMISGFFLIDKTDFRIKGSLKVWTTTFFYSFVGFVLVSLLSARTLSLTELVNYVEPIHSEIYWFVTMYMGMIIIAPYISLGTQSFSKQKYLLLLVVLFVILFEFPFGVVFTDGHDLIWFLFLFLIGGYLKRFELPQWINNYSGLLVFAILTGMVLLFTGVNIIQVSGGKEGFTLMGVSNNNLRIFLSLAVFVWFKNHHFSGALYGWLARLSTFAFGVYLIHEHPLIKDYIWRYAIPDIIDVPISVWVLMVSIGIFCGCCIIDFIRLLVFKSLRFEFFLERIDLFFRQMNINDNKYE